MAPHQLVSVIIPVYNGRNTIAHAVRSALDQTHAELEVIVVDDASTDGTGDILRTIGDPRLRVLRQPRNEGEGQSRNVAIAAALGTWVAMLDADDAWLPERLEKLLALAQSTDRRVVIADNLLQCYTANGRLQPWKPQWSRSEIPFRDGAALLTVEDYLGLRLLLAKPIIPREVLVETGIVHSRRVFGADTEFLIRLLKTGLGLLIAEEPLYLYRKAPGSMSDNPRRAAIMRQMFSSLLEELDFSERERLLIRQRILALERDERYMPFLFDLKAGRWRQAAARCTGDYWLIQEFLRRLPDSFRYRMHTWKHRGETR